MLFVDEAHDLHFRTLRGLKRLCEVVADGYLAQATTRQADIGQPGRGYGFFWWTYDDGSFAARGIFGQGIFIDPKRRLVIVSNSDWDTATSRSQSAAREAFYQAVQKAVDQEAASGPAKAGG